MTSAAIAETIVGVPARARVVPNSSGPRENADRMDAALLLLIPAIFTNIWQWQQIIPGLSSLRLSILSVVAAGVAAAVSRRRFTVLRDPLYTPIRLILAIGVIAIIGGPFAVVRGKALDFVIYLFTPTVVLALLVAHRVRSEYSLRWLVDAFIFGGIPYAWTFVTAPVDSLGKPEGMPFYDANDGGMLAVTCFALALARMNLARSWMLRVIFLGFGLMYLYLVVRSTSRGALLTLIATIVVLLFTVTSVPAKWRLGSVIAAFSLLLVSGTSSYWTFMSTLLNPEDDYNWSGNSDTGRVELWKRGIGYIAENPILGVGAANYAAVEGRSEWARQREMQGLGVKWGVAHNAYVEIGAELGIPGLLCFVGMIAGTMQRLWRASRLPRADLRLRRFSQLLFVALAAFVSGSIFLSSEYWPFLYTLIALAVATSALMFRAERQRRRARRERLS